MFCEGLSTLKPKIDGTGYYDRVDKLEIGDILSTCVDTDIRFSGGGQLSPTTPDYQSTAALQGLCIQAIRRRWQLRKSKCECAAPRSTKVTKSFGLPPLHCQILWKDWGCQDATATDEKTIWFQIGHHPIRLKVQYVVTWEYYDGDNLPLARLRLQECSYIVSNLEHARKGINLATKLRQIEALSGGTWPIMESNQVDSRRPSSNSFLDLNRPRVRPSFVKGAQKTWCL
ncbi:predicted protein [Sclerotinia sclerotiorum 1980 UF-70]|uniref:Uncharacterized protein n=1 Tax=Sclerotinia sclerotiorum (strain ATCC 18683 / 1980 / Ss-1) TaxID=665079 RepID=A7F7H3_SCLS1|nr:predicted protein [Sclerotinia sclerotiorum 1980 UF-70]EDN98694.1 predicted protein [Sclerotinia sclerotiorum 1980 UF-70]